MKRYIRTSADIAWMCWYRPSRESDEEDFVIIHAPDEKTARERFYNGYSNLTDIHEATEKERHYEDTLAAEHITKSTITADDWDAEDIDFREADFTTYAD